MASIKLDIGKKAFPIEFSNGESGTIYFNPNDPDFSNRFFNAQEEIEKRLNNLETEEIILENSGNVDIPLTIEGYEKLSEEERNSLEDTAKKVSSVLEETKKVICEELDKAFDSDVSSVVFKYCSPLGVVNGEYMVVQFLNAILPAIQKTINASNKELEKKMSKHINKYKGK